MEQPDVKYFFEIPIYRCTQEKHQKEMEQEKEKAIHYLISFPDISPEKAEALYRQHPQRNDGISWRFNQIVGYLRLYVETGKDAIKIEYWGIEQKRIPRVPLRKKFVWMGWNISEMWIDDDTPSSEIYERILTLIAEVGTRKWFKERHIDLSSFLAIGPYVDWRGLVDS